MSATSNSGGKCGALQALLLNAGFGMPLLQVIRVRDAVGQR